ncbi:MAG TPA: hypothetical protein VN748_14745 [Pseudonocardiaceae bacterium]|jgi:hypothetical protein|nr:hypothetical protein [Pseudonocardiaceae bacterium]
MSAPQPAPRSRHRDRDAGTRYDPGPDGCAPPRTRPGAVAFPGKSSERAPADWSDRLAGDGIVAIALRRVSGGGMAKMGDHWFDGGRRVPGYVADALTVLCAGRMVMLAELDVWGMQRATLTDTGTARYRQLDRQRHPARRLPVSLPADRPQARNMVQSVWDTLAELEICGQHPGAIAALRRVLADHQPTPAGRCRACRRWRRRRRRFPCLVWHQIHTELR